MGEEEKLAKIRREVATGRIQLGFPPLFPILVVFFFSLPEC
jgi:hypothetical protein